MRCIGINRNLHRCNRSLENRLFCYEHRRQPIVWFFFVVFTVIGGFASIYSAFQGAIFNKADDKLIKENINEHSTIHANGAHELADVTLRLVHPKSPAIKLVNQSSVIAKDIKWAVALWNMDIPDRDDPLPIPVQAFDWIKPHDEGGPQDLFHSPLVYPLLKQGNRLFGSVSVDCPKCERGRTYVVYIVWGVSGWYSEIRTEKAGKILIPSNNFLKESRSKYFKALEAAVPAQSRIPISER